jgi:hypothetical protein
MFDGFSEPSSPVVADMCLLSLPLQGEHLHNLPTECSTTTSHSGGEGLSYLAEFEATDSSPLPGWLHCQRLMAGLVNNGDQLQNNIE